VVLGVAFIVLLLEATRRTTGPIMPVVALLFIAYAMFGPTCRRPGRIAATTSRASSAICSSRSRASLGSRSTSRRRLIILFTIYGAFLNQSGAGKFFIDFSLALMGGKRNSAGRAVVLSSFLLGGPSGSGVATTVMIGTVAIRCWRRRVSPRPPPAGFWRPAGSARSSRPGARRRGVPDRRVLKIGYLDVILMATIPTILYYFSLLLMVEFDAKRFGAKNIAFAQEMTLGQMTRRYGFHFVSLGAVVVFMLVGYSATLSVFYATIVTLALSFIRRDTALVPRKLVRAMADGSIGAINAATTCASAGIIVGVVTLTGLGLKFSSIVIAYAGGSLLLTALYTALIVWVIGLAVPVTASYIICAVIAAPALIKLGVPDFAAHMFIFYYAVLSEVSPPTALAPFAAAAITGGDPYKTTLQSWKYTLPAFLVPFAFVLDPQGIGLLLKIPQGGSWVEIVLITLRAGVGLAALAAAAQSWALRRATGPERLLLALAGLLLVFPSLIEALTEVLTGRDVGYTATLGLAIGAGVVLWQAMKPAAPAPARIA
jgi:TRAP-type uncharacterized transport system fused permease subunit